MLGNEESQESEDGRMFSRRDIIRGGSMAVLYVSLYDDMKDLQNHEEVPHPEGDLREDVNNILEYYNKRSEKFDIPEFDLDRTRISMEKEGESLLGAPRYSLNNIVAVEGEEDPEQMRTKYSMLVYDILDVQRVHDFADHPSSEGALDNLDKLLEDDEKVDIWRTIIIGDEGGVVCEVDPVNFYDSAGYFGEFAKNYSEEGQPVSVATNGKLTLENWENIY